MTEIIEGEAVEVIEPRAVAVVTQPGQALVNRDAGPKDMVRVAADLASALKDIVERQRLYAVIQGKKYPQVEAWMTVARMDNVVCREVSGGIRRHDDGAYEAEVELIRLSDGMVIGRGSALCGSQGDSPWDKRPEPARRSMAVTRATSRAFRQQYSWIMALAGYEPTPAEEMPRDEHPHTPAPAVVPPSGGGGTPSSDGPWAGAVTFGQDPVDGNRRETPDGPVFGFVVTEPIPGSPRGRRVQALAQGELADTLAVAFAAGKPTEAQVWGRLVMVPWEKDGKSMPPYRRVLLARAAWEGFDTRSAPAAASVAPAGSQAAQDAELETLQW